eukprot:187474_1
MRMVVHMYLLLLFTLTTPSISGGATLPPGYWFCGEKATVVDIDTTSDFYLSVNIPHPGDLTLNMTNCAFDVKFIEVFTESGTYVDTNWAGSAGDRILIWLFSFMSPGNYKFRIWVSGSDSGTYDIRTSCSSENLTKLPTFVPSVPPTEQPTTSPTKLPTLVPSVPPTDQQTTSPTKLPTISPTKLPTFVPSVSPTDQPSTPTQLSTTSPSKHPTEIPSIVPTTAQPI